jgi:abortive infection bacteriophage resistance protein
LFIIFFKNYGPIGYRDQDNFHNFTSADFNKFLQTINDVVEKAKRNQEMFVVHFFNKYDEEGNLPLQMLAELISFGTMFTMLKHLHHPLQLNIANEFGVSYFILEKWLLSLNYVRNVCAHNVRLWNRRLGLSPMIPSVKKHPKWKGVQNNYPFVILLILRTLLRRCAPNTAWKNRMEELFDEYSDLPINCMGFPKDWREHILWK